MESYYTHAIDLKKLKIRNAPRKELVDILEKIEYRGYEVEELDDERKIVITKPEGKHTFGKYKKEDFIVFVYNYTDNGLWQITHNQILVDITEKAKENPFNAIKLINLLEKTYYGEEPEDFFDEIRNIKFNTGESAELIIKVYKWLWGQKDVNYPNGLGRDMSWQPIKEIREQLLNA